MVDELEHIAGVMVSADVWDNPTLTHSMATEPLKTSSREIYAHFVNKKAWLNVTDGALNPDKTFLQTLLYFMD